MIAEAERHTPETVRREYAETYRELRAAGYTAVGEFHYLGLPEAHAAIEAAHDAEIEIVLLLSAYARGGIERFRQESTAEYFRQLEELRESGARVGCAPHSVRACPPDWLEEIGAYAERERLPLHVHADEQPREIDECLEEHGVRPIELLSRMGCLGPRTTVVHATHADDRELDLLAEAGARVCICPTTEANLGDGFAPLERLRERESASASAPTRMSGSTRWRSCESWRRRPGVRRSAVRSSMPEHSSAWRRRRRCVTRARVVAGHRRRPGAPVVTRRRPRDVLDALVFGCGADVFVES